jgi:hypothetical protein
MYGQETAKVTSKKQQANTALLETWQVAPPSAAPYFLDGR